MTITTELRGDVRGTSRPHQVRHGPDGSPVWWFPVGAAPAGSVEALECLADLFVAGADVDGLDAWGDEYDSKLIYRVRYKPVTFAAADATLHAEALLELVREKAKQLLEVI